MKLPTYEDVENAAAIVAPECVVTPLIESKLLNERLNARIFLKGRMLTKNRKL